MNIRNFVRFGSWFSLIILALLLLSLPSNGMTIAANQLALQTEPPTAGPTASPTVDPAGLDFTTATTYISSDGAVELQMPRGWNPLKGTLRF